jgi:uncharacterized coiled-coil protein SlyX
MDRRIESLETQMEETSSTLQQLVLQMQQQAHHMQQQSLVLDELSKKLSKKTVSQEGETSVDDSSQSESHLAGKKVKLPVFEGEDPVAWITRAEIYFNVQKTADDMCDCV